jgi:hypothetical protein
MWGRSKRPAQILNSQGGRSLVYTSYNKPSSITQGARTISFLDDTEHQRFKQVTPEGTTLYIGAFGVLAEVQNPGTTRRSGGPTISQSAMSRSACAS